ncbi:hypothetical protein MKX01_028048 [Papaver californicum]|nr:hypothetical protein MKX01_028048 [Papaver californicum]
MKYFFRSWFSLIHQLQPGATIFSDAGPDTRWVGDEAGVAGSTCWFLVNQSSLTIGHTDAKYSGGGDPQGQDWIPAECDVSIRPGGFWHPSELPKSALTLLDIYYKSAGRNCLLLLNVPPSSSGLISDEDVQVLREFTELRRAIFSHNLAVDAVLAASSTHGSSFGDSRFEPSHVLEEGIFHYWAPEEDQSEWIIYLDFATSVSFNMIQIQEPIHMGQRVVSFHLEILSQGIWQTIIKGTTVGYRRLVRFPIVKSRQLRLVIDKARADPLISYLGIYSDPFSVVSDAPNVSSTSYFNASRIIQPVVGNLSSSSSV